MKRNFLKSLAAIGLIISGTAVAEELPLAPLEHELTNKLALTYSSCASYYSTLADSYKNSYYPEKIYDAKLAQRQALHFSLITNKRLYRSAELADEAILKQLENNLYSMYKIAGNDYRHISILVKEYDERCQKALNDPSGFLKSQQITVSQQFASAD